MEETISENIEIKQQEFEPKRASQISENRCLDFDKLIKGVENKSKTPEDLVVEELNNRHAVVHTGQFYILTEKAHSLFKGIDFSLESRQSFVNTYENQIIICSDGNAKSKAKIWLAHENRRQFEGIIFDPSTTEHPNKHYNIWRGFAVESREGTCELLKRHLREVICSGKEEYYAYLLKWAAHLVQKPQELSPGLVLMGEQGIGKNTFVDALGVIFGQHYLPLDNIDQFLGHFNFHLKSAVLIHGNEAVWGGDKRQLGKLKAMVTEQLCVIEGKGKDQLTMRNFKHLILSSNEDWPVHLDRDDRRFLALKVSNKYKDDSGYFSLLHEELNNGGREALLYELQQTNLDSFKVWRVPQNNEAFDIKMMSAPSTERYIYEVLIVGSFDLGLSEQTGSWHQQEIAYPITTESVFMDYKLWCQAQGLKSECDSALGRAISRLVPSSDKIRPRDIGRKARYVFPPINKAREEFQKTYKVGEGIWL